MKRITITLDPQSVDRAIAELEQYRLDVERKTERLRERIGETIAWTASSGFNNAVVDDIIGEPRWANVSVHVDNEGDVTVVFADGQDAVWVEFGAGVYHNGPVGTAARPQDKSLGFTIGSLGKNGRKDVWGFEENGELKLTHGTPAAMPMYRGFVEARNALAEIAREVFA